MDVGRHVFASLNIVESIFMTSIWILKAFSSDMTHVFPLGIVSGLLCVEIALITPVLNTQAKFKILQATADSSHPTEVAYRAQLAVEVRGLRPAAPYWHVVYVSMEVVKAVLLCCISLD